MYVNHISPITTYCDSITYRNLSHNCSERPAPVGQPVQGHGGADQPQGPEQQAAEEATHIGGRES